LTSTLRTAATAGVDALDRARARLLPGVEAALRSFVDRRAAAPSGGPLAAHLPAPNAPAHYGMMRYHLGWLDERLEPAAGPIGKRLRPLICLLAAEACGAPADAALPAAVALELLHNFSLVHDDVEDGDAIRHHRPTVWKLWGEPQAINAGDGMHALAHWALLELAEAGTPPERVVRLGSLLAHTSLIITEGQHLDLAFEAHGDVTPDAYLDMIGRKSAALIACAAAMGAEVAGAAPDTTRALTAFGFDLGMGFQVRDDVLGIWGRSETTGKPAGDLRRRKKTLPSLYAMSRAPEDGRAAIARLFSAARPDETRVSEALAVLDGQHARAYCEQMVARYSASARSHLRALPRAEAREALEALVTQLESREF
jgi:geranylgeranyl diphosphate synthase, type I